MRIALTRNIITFYRYRCYIYAHKIRYIGPIELKFISKGRENPRHSQSIARCYDTGKRATLLATDYQRYATTSSRHHAAWPFSQNVGRA